MSCLLRQTRKGTLMKRLRLAALIFLALSLTTSAFGLGTMQSSAKSYTYNGTTGTYQTWTANKLTSGKILKLVADDDSLNGGLYFQCLGGSSSTTSVFSIGEGGTVTAAGAATFPFMSVVNETTATRTITSADYGKLIVCSYAGATTVTLPAAGTGTIGATFLLTQTVDQNLILMGSATANNNVLIADGVATSDKVSFETASHKIGAMMRVTGVSATKWLVTNASGCTMTVEAAD